jgi:3-hydroxy-D-aspartate aldolase
MQHLRLYQERKEKIDVVLAIVRDAGLPAIDGRDDLEYLDASDEHGVIADPNGNLKINDKLKLVPGHCDPICNLHNWYVGVRDGKVETVWPITARGLSY